MAFVKYQRRSQEQWQKRRDQQGGDFEGIFRDEYQTFQDKKGRNSVRILPPTWEDPDHYGLEVWVHFNVGPKGTVLCPKEHFNKPCPMCEAYTEANRTAESKEDKDAAYRIKAQKRVVVWVVTRDDEDKGPLLWSMPWRLDRDITKQAEDPQTHETYELDDPEAGYDLYYDREGEALTTKRSGITLARRPSSVAKKHLNFIAANPLPDVLRWRNYNEIKALYAGESEEDDGEADIRSARRREAQGDEDPPPRRRRAEPEEDDPVPVPRRPREPDLDAGAEAPLPRSRAREPDPDDEPPARRRTVAPPDEDDDPPPRRARPRNGEDIDDEIPFDRIDRKPVAERARLRPKAEPEDDDPPPRRRARPEPEEEDDDPPPRRASAALREAVDRRRST